MQGFFYALSLWGEKPVPIETCCEHRELAWPYREAPYSTLTLKALHLQGFFYALSLWGEKPVPIEVRCEHRELAWPYREALTILYSLPLKIIPVFLSVSQHLIFYIQYRFHFTNGFSL